jgi:hypothetical protein
MLGRGRLNSKGDRAWYFVLGTLCLVLCAWYFVLGTLCLVLCAWYFVGLALYNFKQNTKYKALSTKD